MHVLLLILKIIGILLLVVLGILPVLVLCLLFIPLRYRVRVQKPPGKFDAALVQAQAEVSWFLRLVRVTAEFKNKAPGGQIRVLTFTLKRFGPSTEKGSSKAPGTSSGKSSKKASKKASEEAAEEAIYPGQKVEKAEPPVELPEKTESSAQEAQVKLPETKDGRTVKTAGGHPERADRRIEEDPKLSEKAGTIAERVEKTSASGMPEGAKASNVSEVKLPKKIEGNAGTKKGISQKDPEASEGLLQSIKRKFSAFVEKLRAGSRKTGADAGDQNSSDKTWFQKLSAAAGWILQKISEVFMKVFDFAWELYFKVSDRLDGVEGKVSAVRKKIDPMTDSLAMNFYCRLLRRGKKLLHHYRLRKGTGYIHFGTGMADVTGQIGGALYLVMPAAAEVELSPDFYERVFDADLEGKGHIRMCYLLWLAVTEILHKDTRTMIKRVKKLRG